VAETPKAVSRTGVPRRGTLANYDRDDRGGVAVRPISVTNFLATVYTILGIDHTRRKHPPAVDRPIPIVDTSKGVKVLSELL
jgi:hypothetical protein